MGGISLVAWLPIILGSCVIIWCYGLFIVVGKGTPWHFDPPKKLVVAGPYRFVRNPMEASFLLILLGEVLLFRSAALVVYWLTGFAILHSRQVLHDEPVLRRRFGASYERYAGSVPRWIPRLSPYLEDE
jgi:protein-S-isoprenylcysteine O-methyltransferase Ste14